MNNSITLKPAPAYAHLLKWMSFLFYPTGVIRIWRGNHRLWVQLVYTLVGLLVFAPILLFLGIICFAYFLHPLDMSVSDRLNRTVYNSGGNYKSTFLKTSNDTKGAYELIEVDVEPHGGNEWHYHKNFDEYFTVLKGKAKVGNNGQEYIVNEGNSAVAHKGEMHYFRNPTDSAIKLRVRVTPARGLEKSIRIAYGLANDGQFDGPITKNPWHMALLLGYSGTYLPDIPKFIQEPLVDALAKIAQWKGEDKALEKYFR